ncbi:MAG TPA: hypothetical protein DCQ31_00685 [Bacteroidales bacterium]|nr:hypothetical protein [Bacteroidales bacterium]
MVRKILIYCFLMVSSIGLFAQVKDWKLERNEAGIAVYSKPSTSRGIKELKIITTIQCDIRKLVNILDDLANAKRYMDSYKVSKTLVQETKNSRWDYVEVTMPWPLSNRDIVVNHSHTFDTVTQTYTSRLKSNPTYIAAKNGIVRLKNMQGGWIIKSTGERSVSTEYYILLDPGENIPAWIINLFVVDVPFETISKLRALAEKEA